MRIREWAARYLPAEAAAVVGVLLGTAAVGPLGSPAATAYGATIGEAVLFYGFVAARDLRRQPREGQPREGQPYKRLGRTLKEMALEFGPAEVVDTVAARPLA